MAPRELFTIVLVQSCSYFVLHGLLVKGLEGYVWISGVGFGLCMVWKGCLWSGGVVFWVVLLELNWFESGLNWLGEA